MDYFFNFSIEKIEKIIVCITHYEISCIGRGEK